MPTPVDTSPASTLSANKGPSRGRFPRKVLEDAPDISHLLRGLPDDDPFLRSGIEVLSPSVRTRHVFEHACITSVGDLRYYNDARLLRFSGFGLKSLSQVKQALMDYLSPSVIDPTPTVKPTENNGLQGAREILLIQIFVASEALSKTISDALVGARLAASGHIRSVQSQYPRSGFVETVEEWALEIRSVSWLFQSIVQVVQRLQPGSTPLILALPCAGVSEGPAQWIISECDAENPAV